MKPSALFIIESDPRQNGRPAEAVRIAAGVGAWNKVKVAVYLREAAVLILGEETEALVDGENYARYLPLLLQLSAPIYTQKEAALLVQLGQAEFPFEEISDDQLAGMAAAHSFALRF
jgi:hypothetical protein